MGPSMSDQGNCATMGTVVPLWEHTVEQWEPRQLLEQSCNNDLRTFMEHTVAQQRPDMT
jgi:hypothetical protein